MVFDVAKFLKFVPVVFLTENIVFCGGGPGGNGGTKGVTGNGMGTGGSCGKTGITGCGKHGKTRFSLTSLPNPCPPPNVTDPWIPLLLAPCPAGNSATGGAGVGVMLVNMLFTPELPKTRFS